MNLGKGEPLQELVEWPGTHIKMTSDLECSRHWGNPFLSGWKRILDIIVSSSLLLLLSPLFAIIAVAVKLTSRGPVFYRWRVVGRNGWPFTGYKFRSMCADADLLKEQLERLNEMCGPVFKLTNDPRVTAVGRFLRKTSLDEFPQFWNVLCGEMSLVGPRPPVAYEFEMYDYWHRRRVFELKPGVTGLWQVNGRSKVKFDDMVRMDLHYAKTWSLWLDIKILLQTPAAVLFGAGGY